MQNFTPSAQKLWNKIPAEVRMQILNSVWCASCRDTVTMLNISGKVEGGDLVLRGKCERCAGPVVRLIESD